MSRWWRAYDEAVDDPKLLLLSDRAHRAWFNLMCLASIGGGRLPERKVMELKLRLAPAKLKVVLDELLAAGLLDQDEAGFAPHNWNGRQYKSDVSTERVKRFRNGQRNVSVTPPENRVQNTESKIGADAPDDGYAFDGRIVKLRRKSFDDWVRAYPNLDLIGELTARDAWLASDRATDADRKRWFVSTSQHLANRNMQAKAKVVAMKPDGRPMSKAEELYREGIV